MQEVAFSTFFRERRGGYVRLVRLTVETRRWMHDAEIDASDTTTFYRNQQQWDRCTNSDLADAVENVKDAAIEYLRLAAGDPVMGDIAWWRVKEAVDRFNAEVLA